MRHPALRTVRAVFPHTALQSVVSSSRLSRSGPGLVKCEQPVLCEVGIGPQPTEAEAFFLPPLTPFTSADSIRSVQTAASAPAIMQRASAPCAALWGIPGAVCASVVVFTSPPSCPPFLGPVYAARASRGLRRIGPMRALPPGGLALARQVSPLPLRCLPSIQPPTTTWASTSLYQSPQRIERGLTPENCSLVKPQASPVCGKLAAHHAAETGSSSYRLLVRLRLLPTSPHGDAVTFGYTGRDLLWTGLPPA